MSIELFESLIDKYNLYRELEKGLESIEKGEIYSSEQVFKEIDDILKD